MWTIPRRLISIRPPYCGCPSREMRRRSRRRSSTPTALSTINACSVRPPWRHSCHAAAERMQSELPFRARRLVRFADCDPAGIVYFPRYFDFFHAAVEDWFREGLELDYWGMLRDRRLGLPAVHTSCD